MKKLVLGLFLVLTAMSFSAPRFVDVNGIKRKKYRIIADTDIGFSYLAKNSESGKYISLSYYYGRNIYHYHIIMVGIKIIQSL